MSTEIEVRAIDEGARAYLEGRLRRGLTMSQLVLERLQSSELDLKAYVGRDASPDAIAQLEVGGVAASDQSRLRLVEDLYAELSRREGMVLVPETRLARPADPVLARAASTVTNYGDEVYHLVFGGADV